jgi:hypothetical protein
MVFGAFALLRQAKSFRQRSSGSKVDVNNILPKVLRLSLPASHYSLFFCCQKAIILREGMLLCYRLYRYTHSEQLNLGPRDQRCFCSGCAQRFDTETRLFILLY